METLHISTGEKRLAVSVDGVNGREITFNPNDILFVERLHRFYRLAMQKAREWEARQAEYAAKLADVPVDDNGMPETLDTALEPLNEMNAFMREQIDLIFGEGTAKAVFGEAVYRNPAVYVQLIEGVKPFVEAERVRVVEKYVTPAPSRKPRKPRARAK